jgi:hypothetical protein
MMNLMNKPQKQDTIPKARLSNTHYFASLLQEAASRGLLSRDEQRSIRAQMMQIMEFLATRYTAGASTSIRVETAQSLMECAMYSIGHTLKRLPNTDAALAELKEIPLKVLFDRGQVQLRELLADAKAQYAALQKNCVPLCSHTWQSTIHTGLAEFFAVYHVYDAAHGSPGLIDYPTALPLEDAVGIEFITRYLKRLELEDSLIRRWPADEVNGLIRAGGAVEAPVNVFSLVLTNALGAMLCGRHADTLSLSRDDRKVLRQRLSGIAAAPMRRLLRHTADALCKSLGIQDKALHHYMSDTAATLVAGIRNALETGTLSRTFLTIKAASPPAFFHDAPRMDGKQFRIIVSEIAECRYASDRVELVRMNVKSIADMVDLFEAHCLTQSDMTDVLQTLGDDALAMLLHISREYAPDSLHTNSAELTWRLALKTHIEELVAQQREHIKLLARNIKFV